MLTKKDLLGLYDVSAEEITEILDRAEEMKALLNKGRKAESLLKGRALITLFYENSTRTRTSFELAGKYLGRKRGEYSRCFKLGAEGRNAHRYGQDARRNED